MAAGSAGSTSPELLRRVAAVSDNPAWGEFFERYDAFVRARCSVYGLDSASMDELCQRIWVELRGGCRLTSTIPAGRFAAGSGGFATTGLSISCARGGMIVASR